MDSSNGGRRARLALALSLVVLALAAFAPALDAGFVDFDDDTYVTDNPFVRHGLSVAGLRWALTTAHAANWHPLTWLAHQLDVELWGLDPRGHHLSSVLLHAANTLVLFSWLAGTTGRAGRSAWVAALFAVHPLRVESVAWIAERKDLLAGLFGLSSLWAYCAWARAGGRARYLLAWGLLAAGVAAKPTLVTLPFVFLLADRWPLGRLGGRGAHPGLGRLVAEKLPFFALAAASAAVTLAAQRHGGAVGSLEAVAPFARLGNAVVSYARYLWKTVWPAELAVLYPHPALPGGRPWSTWQIAGAALVLAAITAAVVRAHSRPALATGWLWFVGMLVPAIGLVQVGVQAMADRYTYLPSIGLALAVVWGLADLSWPGRSRIVIGATGSIAVVALVLVTRAQTRHWRDPVALYAHAIEVTGGSSIQHNNLGAALERLGRKEEAERHYTRALELDRASPGAHENLSRLLLERGQTEAALEQAHAAIALRPDSAGGHVAAGNALAAKGRHGDAARAFRRALESRPTDASIHYNLANALASSSRFDESLAAYREALRLDPSHAAAHTNLGNLLLSRGRLEEAVREFRDALSTDPNLAEAWQGLGTALARRGEAAEAAGAFGEAAARRPGWNAPLLARAWILATSPDATVRDGPQAVELAQQALAAGAPDARALDTLAAALAECGRFDEAEHRAAEAAELADRTGDPLLAARVRERLRGYAASTPHRASSRAAGPSTVHASVGEPDSRQHPPPGS